MTRRKTLAEVRADAAAVARKDTIAEVCRVLKYHLDMGTAAEALWLEMESPSKKRQKPKPGVYASYSMFDTCSY